jgi:hypothetical protein
MEAVRIIEEKNKALSMQTPREVPWCYFYLPLQNYGIINKIFASFYSELITKIGGIS